MVHSTSNSMALYSDVDVEMAGSIVTATATETASTTDDAFISYTITYNTGELTEETEPVLATTYAVTRTTMEAFAADLQEVLEDIVLEKNSAGYITVQYAWVDTSTLEGDANLDAADTALGLAWAGLDTSADYDVATPVAPTFTILIDNVASQVMEANPTYTAAFSTAD